MIQSPKGRGNRRKSPHVRKWRFTSRHLFPKWVFLFTPSLASSSSLWPSLKLTLIIINFNIKNTTHVVAHPHQSPPVFCFPNGVSSFSCIVIIIFKINIINFNITNARMRCLTMSKVKLYRSIRYSFYGHYCMWSVPLAPRNLQAVFIFFSAFEHLHLWFDIPSHCMHSAILLQYGMPLMLLFSSLLTQTLLSHFLHIGFLCEIFWISLLVHFRRWSSMVFLII